METIGVFIFLAAMAGAFAFGIVGWMQKLEARRITASCGREAPLSLRANIAIEIRKLHGEAIAPAIRSNQANGLAGLLIAVAAWGSFIADPTTVSALFAGLVTLLAAVGSMRLLRLNKPIE
jgi:hypothetical protein